ncbi:hypothetical protein HDU93_007591 [Gonapodya sp. JEL0774]|nr:hypothetical protein HDU93_007591 [Gonapodya sp. JEL0774]
MPSTSSTTQGGWSLPPILSFLRGQQDRQSEKSSPVVVAVQKDKSQDDTLVLEARYALALACFSGGQAVRTVKILEEMIKPPREENSKEEDKSVESLEWRLHLGRAYLACNRQRDGKTEFERVKRLSPDGHPLKALAILEIRNIGKKRTWMDTISIDSMINALSNSSNGNTLSFKDRIIGVVGARALAHALKQGTVASHLTILDLSGSSVEVEGLQALGDALARTTMLIELDLEDNVLIGEKAGNILKEALKGLTSLQKLNLKGE